MCGIAGFAGGGLAGAEGVLRSMADALVHRGPDSMGVWTDGAGGCGLAHRRLAIVDLSDAGRQPMASGSGRYVVAFNGEVYNHLSLRAQLGERPWRGHSDTETLLAAFERWGVEGTLSRTVGMFAIALWDRHERTLHLMRDRLGEKPLHYGWVGGQFVFASELKALRAYPGFDATIDRDALAAYMRHGYVPAPHTIWRGMRKLPPGTLLSLPFGAGGRAARDARPSAWWSLESVVARGQAEPFGGDLGEAADALEQVLGDAIRLQRVADVPLGAFLSGGLDSSLVVALMQRASAAPIETFTIGFHEKAFDESPHARLIARHLGTRHHEHIASAADALAVVPGLARTYDEPFADSSQIPTSLVCAAARRHVTVALSGDGGDELFGGYGRYLYGQALWQRLRAVSGPLRRLGAAALTSVPPGFWDGANAAFRRVLPAPLRVAHAGEKAARLAAVLGADGAEAVYREIVSHWVSPASLVIGAVEPATAVNAPPFRVDELGIEHFMMALDTVSYLPDDILVKVDRAAMATSLETRVPFLDHRVVEFAWSLPLAAKLNGGVGKRVVREVLHRHVPRALIERPKQGFGVPIGAWLRGPLRDWAAALLDPARLHGEGYLHGAPIERKWREHTEGVRDWGYYLWDVLMFQAWLERQGDAAASDRPCAPTEPTLALA
jgi:asparagine synthase (glutamine-hydrolysing)